MENLHNQSINSMDPLVKTEAELACFGMSKLCVITCKT